MSDNDQQITDMLKDLIKINAVIATELVQLVENTSRQLHGGDVPETCKAQHQALKKEVIEMAEKWSDACQTLRDHNLDHD